MDFFKKIKYAIDINKAFSLYEKGEYKKSFAILLKHKDLANKYKINMPEYFIFFAANLTMLKKFKESEKYFLEAINILEETTIFNNDERNYLKAYIIYWIKYLKNYIHFKNNEFFEKLINSELEFDLYNVRKSLQINFPLDLT